jgi:purine nucleosidase
VRLWIDTDVGTNPDDAFALLAAVGHPDVELVGISTVDGDTDVRARVARGLVAAPVVAGTGLTRLLVEAARPDAGLAIGPLTNIAGLVEREYRFPRLAVMGGALGAVTHRGAEREIEHNFGSDPSAVRTVLDSGMRPLICPLDLTARMKVDPGDLSRFVVDAPVLEAHCAQWIARQRASGVPAEEAVVCLHDPLALLALLDEPMLTIEAMRIQVDGDGRLFADHDGRLCDVVVDVDLAAAFARIVELVARGARTSQ